jgi:hypothetical protein
MEVVVMRIPACRLVKNPGGSNHRFGRALVASRVPQEASLEVVGAEEPLHARLIVHDKGTYEMPVPRFVETEDPITQSGEAEAIEAQPAVTVDGQAACVPGEKQQIGIAPGAMGAMPRM